jgi:tetratricopeptide (TPR) repeat protein
VSLAEARRVVDRASELADAGDYDRALRETDRAIALAPDYAGAYTERGWALENLGSVRLSEAREAYERALELDPDDLWAVLGLATVLVRFGSSDRADELYRRIVVEAPPRLDAQPDLAEALGWAQYRVGMHSAAVATLRQVVDADPRDVAVRLDLALILLVGGFREEAITEFEAAMTAAGPDHRGILAVAIDDLEATLTERPGLSSFGGDRARAMLAEGLVRVARRSRQGARTGVR